MKEKSVFLEMEGYSPKNKVLDFLIIAQDFDYSLKDIARYSKISYPCIKQLKKELVKDKWIILMRRVGKAQMYKLNLKNKKVQKFVGFYWAVVNEGVEKELGMNDKSPEESYGTAVPIAVSARNV